MKPLGAGANISLPCIVRLRRKIDLKIRIRERLSPCLLRFVQIIEAAIETRRDDVVRAEIVT